MTFNFKLYYIYSIALFTTTLLFFQAEEVGLEKLPEGIAPSPAGSGQFGDGFSTQPRSKTNFEMS
jgi:hypothetical protein